MMVRIARSAAPQGIEIIGATAQRSPPMIVDPTALASSAAEVSELGLGLGREVSGIIVGAFGDPGLADLRRKLDIPVVGIAEAAMREAAREQRRFGIATTTPALAAAIAANTAALGLGHLYSGVRLTSEDPLELVAAPERLVEALGEAIAACIRLDGAQAVIIGGGPLGNAATALAARFEVPVIAPIPAAVRRLMKILGL